MSLRLGENIISKTSIPINDVKSSNSSTYSSKKINKKNINCKIIAHRGYHIRYPQNTVESIIDGIENGFEWFEIDIRKTADGYYVMSHDDAITLYNNGVATSITVSTANYTDFMEYTWDSAGLYPINTFEEILANTRGYNVHYILDRKSGDNLELVKICARQGMLDKIMLSIVVSSVPQQEIDYLKTHAFIPIRLNVSNWNNIQTFLTYNIPNQIYADINVSSSSGLEYVAMSISHAKTLGIPTICCGATNDNIPKWAGMSGGVFANSNLNFSFDYFYNKINQDLDRKVKITADTTDTTIAVGNTLTKTATSNSDTLSGYVYAFSDNPSIAEFINVTYGKSIEAQLIGVSQGETYVNFICPGGYILRTKVTVE